MVGTEMAVAILKLLPGFQHLAMSVACPWGQDRGRLRRDW